MRVPLRLLESAAYPRPVSKAFAANGDALRNVTPLYERSVVVEASSLRPMVPTLLTLKSVVFTPALVDEPTAKRFMFAKVEDAYTESNANGEVVPTPTVPLKFAFANCEVLDAKRPFCAKSGVEVAEVLTPKLVVGVNGQEKFA